MADPTNLRGAFQVQAAFCRSSGSPMAALVLEAIEAKLDSGAPYRAFLAPWFEAKPGALFADAVTLRLIGAFHYLVLSGRAPDLAALYPPNVLPDPAALDAALVRAAVAHADVIQGFMASPPQTNEVGRSLCLVGGFLTVAAETGLPLRCLELGASAGLNMNWDRFAYGFGEGAAWGEPNSLVQFKGQWNGAPPPLPSLTVIERRACDQNPIDVTDADSALRLQSYVWPDQTLRLDRLRAAIALKRETGGVPERADAGVWADAHVHPTPGAATVVYHSVFFQYPPRATQARIRVAIERAGAAASADAPLAWLSMEPDPQNMAGPMEVRLRMWPTGEERLLAHVHPHGASVKWLA